MVRKSVVNAICCRRRGSIEFCAVVGVSRIKEPRDSKV